MNPADPKEKRRITIEDVNQIKYVDDPQISPDGQWVAYVLRAANPMEKGYTQHIYVAATDGSRKPLQLTRSGKDNTPRWSPDGTRLAFVSTRSDKPQIYILPVGGIGGEARPLTSMETGAVAPAWSPDGTQIAFLSRRNADERAAEDDDSDKETPPQDQLEAKQRKERKQQAEQDRFDPRPMERIPYRQGTSFLDDRYAQIYVLPTADDLSDDEKKARRLTNLDADYNAVEWSPDGTTLYTSRTWRTEADEPWMYSNLYRIDVASGDETRIEDEDFRYNSPLPSPDGQWLIASRGAKGSTDAMLRLVLMRADGSDPVDLNLDLDRPVYGYHWHDDSTLTVVVAENGKFTLHHLDPQTRTFTPEVTDEQAIFGMDRAADGALVYVSSTTQRPDELFYLPPDGTPQQLTTHNQDFLDAVQVQETHSITYKNPHGDDIQGWYILPPDYEEGKQYPLALNIHGGPHVMWTPSARSMWHEWQVHAAEGYVVFYCNPRGSDGYGEGFQKALHANWGNVAMEDIMAGVDVMIDKGFVDAERMAITGGSYGGYMTSWIIGHTDRFKSAVSQRGVYNLSSFYGTSDVPILISAEFDGEPWEIHDTLWEHSPLKYAHHITTPTLLIHSENDFRVPIEQAEQLFAWIRRATDTPVKMLRYPREGHELSRSGEPAHRISRLKEMVNWFNRYCQPEKYEADMQPAGEDTLTGSANTEEIS